MRKIRAFARTIEPVIYWLAFTTLSALLVKSFVLDKIPAPVEGLAELGRLVDTVLRSLLGGTIFYVTVTATKTYTDRKRLAGWLSKRLVRIVGRHEEFVQELRDSANIGKLAPVEEALAIIKSTDAGPEMVGGSVNWGEHLKNYADGIVEIASQVGRRGSFMDSDVLSVVTELEHCTFLHMATELPKVVARPFRFSTFWEPFREYDKLVCDLASFQKRLGHRYDVREPEGSRFIRIEPVENEQQPADGAPVT